MDRELERKQALAEHLGCEIDEIKKDGDNLCFHQEEYLVLHESELFDRAAEYISDNLWAFNANFLVHYTGTTTPVIQAILSEYENGNDVLLRLVGSDLNFLIHDAINSDGYGHFFAAYDGQEYGYGEYCVYRTN